MLKASSLRKGFTLIELMIGIAIMALLLALAAPAFSTYSENAKLRGISGSFLASAQTARIIAPTTAAPGRGRFRPVQARTNAATT